MVDFIAGNIDGVVITPLKEIKVAGGNVLHAMKVTDPGCIGFGEAYFSQIEPDVVKPWKRHRQMTLNLVVPVGVIRFVIFDDRLNSRTYGKFQEVSLSQDNYCRLTIPPMLWMAFQGTSDGVSLLLNIADILHDPSESDRKSIDEITFAW